MEVGKEFTASVPSQNRSFREQRAAFVSSESPQETSCQDSNKRHWSNSQRFWYIDIRSFRWICENIFWNVHISWFRKKNQKTSFECDHLKTPVFASSTPSSKDPFFCLFPLRFIEIEKPCEISWCNFFKYWSLKFRRQYKSKKSRNILYWLGNKLKNHGAFLLWRMKL